MATSDLPFKKYKDKGQRDLERKASFATEGVKRYGESSANGGRTRNYNKNEENRRFSTLISLNYVKTRQRHCFFDNASAVFCSVTPK